MPVPPKLVDDDDWHVCAFCEAEFDELDDYYEHLREHIVFPDVGCWECKILFSKATKYSAHRCRPTDATDCRRPSGLPYGAKLLKNRSVVLYLIFLEANSKIEAF